MFQKFLALFTFLGITSATVKQSPEGVFVSEAELEKLEGLRSKVDSLTGELSTASTAQKTAEEAQQKAEGLLSEANTKLADLQGQLDTVKAASEAKDTEIATLTQKLTGKPAQGANVSRTGTEGSQADTEADWETINGLEHNQKMRDHFA